MNLKTIMSKAVLENMSSGAAQAIKELDDNTLMAPKELESYLTQRLHQKRLWLQVYLMMLILIVKVI